ncbi:right-handed parallel beta-helix repeat-containing protein [bacterium]|nr:right-handed parallel beta-helix repeat-containing protein [bacterium]
MKRIKLMALTALILAGIGLIAYALLTSTNYQYTETVLVTGGDTAASVNYRYTAGLGQPAASDSVASANYVMRPGFYHEITAAHTGSIWYVNASTGHDTLGNGTSSSPFKTIQRGVNSAAAGETVQIAAGTYTETTILITTSNIALVGADSRTTIIDPPGANTVTNLYGILAQNVTGLVLKNLGVTGAYTGVRFDNVDFSTVTGDSFGSNSRHGIELVNGSDTNTITQCDLSHNVVGSGFGIEINGSAFNTLSNSILNANGQYGVYTSSGNDNTVSGNTVNSNSSYGMFLLNSARLIVKNNTVTGGASQGIRLNNGSNCVFTGNTVNSNQYGIVIAGPSARVTNNVMSQNSIYGLWVINGSNLYAAQNTITDNTQYQISFDPLGPTNSLVEKNNFKTSTTNPDSIVYNRSDTIQTVTRNWWGTTDEAVIRTKIFDTAASLKTTFKPYRLAQVDTAAGADTGAPMEPQAVAANTSIAGAVQITWTNPAFDEDTATQTAFGGVDVYRLVNVPDSANWVGQLLVSLTGTPTSYTDAAVSVGNTYYYRLSSHDTATLVNSSFLTDTVSGSPVSGSAGDSVLVDSGSHQIISNGGNATLSMDVKDSASGTLITSASVSVTAVFNGAAVSALDTTLTTDTAGRARVVLKLSQGEGVYVFTASPALSGGQKARFVVYTDRRPVQADKWTMFAPFKKPVSGVNGITVNGTPGPGSVILYWYDPAATAVTTFGQYKSVSGQASPNSSTAGTFSDFQSGRAYWAKSVGAAVTIGAASGASDVPETVYYQVHVKEGWNMVGNPFPFFIDWEQDVFFDTNPLDTEALQCITTAAAETAGVLTNKIYWRDESVLSGNVGYRYGPSTATSTETTVQLKPWAGFWVYLPPAPAVCDTGCTLLFSGSIKRIPQTVPIQQQAPSYLTETEKGRAGEPENWVIQIKAVGQNGARDDYNFVGVAPGAKEGYDRHDAYKAPPIGDYVQVGVRPLSVSEYRSIGVSEKPQSPLMAASLVPPVTTVATWEVVVAASSAGAATLSWDAAALPGGYGAYLLGGPAGPVDLLKSQSLPLSLSPSLPFSLTLTLAVGTPEHLAPFLAAPLSKENTFIYPNPGPDATGSMSFKYNLQGAADVSLKIFDMGGKLVKEMKGSGIAGSNTLTWDTTNKHGQRLGSGVYIYKLESGGTTLVDKLAIVR